MKRYNDLNILNLPETVYLSTQRRKRKGEKKVLKNLQGFKRKMPLYSSFATAWVVKSSD